MKKIIISSFFFLLIFNIQAQKKSKSISEYPPATTAKIRMNGFSVRKKLIENSLVKDLAFRNVGPTVMSGRVTDFAVNPTDPTHFYVAYASGGLWETKNEGITFQPMFDDQAVMSIGDIAVDWKNNIIYVGTGENNSSRSSYSGMGIFKSRDNGVTWISLGLADTQHIGRIIIHPSNPNIIWVAALGHLYSPNSERGIYKSNDAGRTWIKTLFVDDGTGAIDLVIDPKNPNNLYASLWTRDRKAWNFDGSGEGSGIYKSSDGGQHWDLISGADSGFPDSKGTGRIGLDIFPDNPNIVFAILDNQDRKATSDEDEQEGLTKNEMKTISTDQFAALDDSLLNDFLRNNGFPKKYEAGNVKNLVKSRKIKPIALAEYLEDANSMLFDTPVKGAEVYRSDDGGKTWKKTHEKYLDRVYNSYGYYFGEIRVDAKNPDLLYVLGVPLIKSDDGGKSWKSINGDNQHGDHQALWVNPNRSGHLINGNDGGINITFDDGGSWSKVNTASVGQFYDINYDMAEPYNIYGGLQDNGVWYGPSSYEYSSGYESRGKYPWRFLSGGDGMQTEVDTRDNDTVYTGMQFGHYWRIDKQTGKRKKITPMQELGDRPFRWNWESPIHLSRHNQDILYMGSNHFHRSMNQGDDFETLSDDLTLGGKKGNVSYGTLTTIAESPLKFGLIYIGTDDGLIQLTKDGGYTWSRINTGIIPARMWVSSIVPSQFKEGRVYLTLNGYRWDNFEPMVFVSENFGKSWKKIGLNLPIEAINVIAEDPTSEKVLYVGTDHGAYVSINRGSSFMAFNSGLPQVAVHDLAVHPRENELIVGTHGRSVYVADVKPLQKLAGQDKSQPLIIYPITDVKYNKNWGNYKWGSQWYGYNEPETTVTFYSSTKAKGVIRIYDDGYLLYESLLLDFKKGLNFYPYDLTKSGDATEDGSDAAKNGKFYLQTGEYELEIEKGETVKTSELKIVGG